MGSVRLRSAGFNRTRNPSPLQPSLSQPGGMRPGLRELGSCCNLIHCMPPLPSQRIKSNDAEISYWVLGDGQPVVLLHPFPANHESWLPVAEALSTRYRLIMPDLRGHGESEIGEGPALMEKNAADLANVMDAEDVGRAPLIGVSIGGYTLFEFWRRHRG